MKSLNKRVILGRTGLSVSRLGIASSYGADADMIEAAYDGGINYFYWGAMRTSRMAAGIRRLAQVHREDMVIVMHTNAQFGFQLNRLFHMSLRMLGVDYVDILLMGWRNKIPGKGLVERAREMQEKGFFKFLGVSAHNRLIFKEFEKDKLFDVMHVRYNAAHRGAEKEVFPYLPVEGGPGVVSFTNTRWGGLLHPKNMPDGEKPPSAVDCYRFVLSHPQVHSAVSGPNSMAQLKENLALFNSSTMSDEELSRMRRIGDHVHSNVSQLRDNLRGMSTIKFWSKAKEPGADEEKNTDD